MPGTKTNEIPGTRAQVRHARMSAYKAREVLDLIRGLPVGEAQEVLQFTERSASVVIARALTSAVANAQHNDELDPDTLYVSTCYADEGPTLKRWRPRARGRATRIRKRMCHITIIVSPMPPEMAARVEARQVAGGTTPAGRRRARVARSRGEAVTAAEPEDEEPTTEEPTDEVVEEVEAELADAEVEPPEDTDGEAVDVEDEAPVDEADESPADDESTDDRGVDSAAGGDAEGDASTEAENDADQEKK